MPLNDAHPVSRKITIPLPPNTTALGMSLSPDGTRLLWSLRIEKRLPGPAWMQSVCARLGMQTRIQRGLWVSRRDGSALREIGHVVEKPADIAKTPRGVVTAAVQQFMAQWLSRALNHTKWLPTASMSCSQWTTTFTLSP